jgi:hypothetical protein
MCRSLTQVAVKLNGNVKFDSIYVNLEIFVEVLPL